MKRASRSHVAALVIAGGALVCGCSVDDGDDGLLPLVEQVDHLEDFRPQFHFTPLSGWMNDPNGLVRVGDTWHLYHQYIPGEYVVDRMDWGHAVSDDLVHWTYMPSAIGTNPDLGMAYSGSAVVDSGNTSGLCGSDPLECVLAFFTHSQMLGGDQKQSLAVSHDGGMTFSEYESNPIMPNPGKADFRDPKVFLYDGSLDDGVVHAPRAARAEDGPLPEKWVMALAEGDRIGFYTSARLLEWQPLSSIVNPLEWTGDWECPDLIRMPVENEPGIHKWVLLVSVFDGAPWDGSGVQYIVGDFDGYTFTPDDDMTTRRWLDHGWDFYAAQSFSNVPADDGRVVIMAWMNSWKYALGIPAMPWQGTMAFPRSLTLTRMVDGSYALMQAPVDELASLRRGVAADFENLPLYRDVNMLNGEASSFMYRPVYSSDTGLYEIDVTGPRHSDWKLLIVSTDVAPSPEALTGRTTTVASMMNTRVSVGIKDGSLVIDRGNALCDGCPSNMGMYYAAELTGAQDLAAAGLPADKVSLKILADHSSVEVFADGGRTTMTALTFLPGPGWSIVLEAYDETLEKDVIIDRITVQELLSAWGVDDRAGASAAATQ